MHPGGQPSPAGRSERDSRAKRQHYCAANSGIVSAGTRRAGERGGFTHCTRGGSGSGPAASILIPACCIAADVRRSSWRLASPGAAAHGKNLWRSITEGKSCGKTDQSVVKVQGRQHGRVSAAIEQKRRRASAPAEPEKRGGAGLEAARIGRSSGRAGPELVLYSGPAAPAARQGRPVVTDAAPGDR